MQIISALLKKFSRKSLIDYVDNFTVKSIPKFVVSKKLDT